MFRPHRRDVSEIGGHLLGIVTNHQLREHPFERAARHQGPQALDRVIGHHIALVQDDHLVADALDDFEDVRTVKNRLAP
jgi:hypothetical protein